MAESGDAVNCAGDFEKSPMLILNWVLRTVLLVAVLYLALRAYRRGRHVNALLYALVALGILLSIVARLVGPRADVLSEVLQLLAAALVVIPLFIFVIRELEEKTTREIREKMGERSATTGCQGEMRPDRTEKNRLHAATLISAAFGVLLIAGLVLALQDYRVWWFVAAGLYAAILGGRTVLVELGVRRPAGDHQTATLYRVSAGCSFFVGLTSALGAAFGERKALSSIVAAFGFLNGVLFVWLSRRLSRGDGPP